MSAEDRRQLPPGDRNAENRKLDFSSLPCGLDSSDNVNSIAAGALARRWRLLAISRLDGCPFKSFRLIILLGLVRGLDDTVISRDTYFEVGNSFAAVALGASCTTLKLASVFFTSAVHSAIKEQ